MASSCLALLAGMDAWNMAMTMENNQESEISGGKYRRISRWALKM
jgi:hypothetical protein